MADRRVLDHLYVARHAAKGLHGDFLGSALEALCKAARDWDADRCPEFAVYAWTRCRQAVMDEWRRVDPLSRADRRLYRAYWDTFDKIAEDGGTPTCDEVAKRLNVTGPRRVWLVRVAALGYYREPSEASFDPPDPHDGPEDVVWAMLLDQMRTAAAGLPARLGYVYRRLYVDGAEQQTVAAELGVSQSFVSQLRRQVEAFLRDAMCGESAA